MQRTTITILLPLLFLFVLAGPAYSRGNASEEAEVEVALKSFVESELPRITEEQSGIAQYPIGLSCNED